MDSESRVVAIATDLQFVLNAGPKPQRLVHTASTASLLPCKTATSNPQRRIRIGKVAPFASMFMATGSGGSSPGE
jgi:hypothetical protein